MTVEEVDFGTKPEEKTAKDVLEECLKWVEENGDWERCTIIVGDANTSAVVSNLAPSLAVYQMEVAKMHYILGEDD